MAGVNRATIMGNLGGDPDVRYSQGGMAVVKFSVATSERRKDKDGNTVESTDWHRVVAFGKQGEVIGEHFHKGDPIYLEGRIKYDKYTDKEGVERWTTDIVVDRFEFVGGRKGGDDRPARTERPARPETPPAQQAADDEFDDDSIPY